MRGEEIESQFYQTMILWIKCLQTLDVPPSWQKFFTFEQQISLPALSHRNLSECDVCRLWYGRRRCRWSAFAPSRRNHQISRTSSTRKHIIFVRQIKSNVNIRARRKELSYHRRRMTWSWRSLDSSPSYLHPALHSVTISLPTLSAITETLNVVNKCSPQGLWFEVTILDSLSTGYQQRLSDRVCSWRQSDLVKITVHLRIWFIP